MSGSPFARRSDRERQSRLHSTEERAAEQRVEPDEARHPSCKEGIIERASQVNAVLARPAQPSTSLEGRRTDAPGVRSQRRVRNRDVRYAFVKEQITCAVSGKQTDNGAPARCKFNQARRSCILAALGRPIESDVRSRGRSTPMDARAKGRSTSSGPS
jgi:hypothetical protein